MHNDITTTNITIVRSFAIHSNQCTPTNISISGNYQIVLIDFRKATKCEKGSKKGWSIRKVSTNCTKVRKGESRQSVYSDIFAVGGILYQITESGCICFNMHQKCLLNIVEVPFSLLFQSNFCN